MSWFLASVLVVLLVTSSTVMETDAGEPTVYHIESPKGNFFMAPNMTINSHQAQHILTKNVTNCRCKRACSAVACKAWSVVKVDDDQVECRLANAGPVTVIPEENTNAIYFFNEDSIDGKYSFHKEDNLLYVEMITPMWFDAGKKACQDIPGHRLMIIKTEVQYEYFQSLWETHKEPPYVAVDLMRKIKDDGSIEHVWGDGTLYSDTTLKQQYVADDQASQPSYDIYVNVDHIFNDYIRSIPLTIICQANPFGVEW